MIRIVITGKYSVPSPKQGGRPHVQAGVVQFSGQEAVWPKLALAVWKTMFLVRDQRDLCGCLKVPALDMVQFGGPSPSPSAGVRSRYGAIPVRLLVCTPYPVSYLKG